MTNPEAPLKTVTYHDFWVKIIGSLVASELIDAVGRNGSILERINTKSFFIDLAAGFFISIMLWELIRYVIKKLDQRMDWLAQPILRISLQLIFGVAVPACLAFVFTMFYMQLAWQQDIFQTTWLHSEFFVVILIIVMINLVYFTWWLFLKNKTESSLQSSVSNLQLSVNSLQPSSHKGFAPIQVTKGNSSILLQPSEIAYVTLDSDYTFIYTNNDDHFVTTYTLEELSKKLDELQFFRANRQTIINRSACKSYRRMEHGKIGLDLEPNPKSPVIISQKSASNFRKWIAGQPITPISDILQD
jgi:hypothetical protein